MVTVSEASATILGHLFNPVKRNVSIAECLGKVLGEAVLADRDFPPFNRVSMDGVAIQYNEWLTGRRSFAIQGVQAAGEEQKSLADQTFCLEVMTGAMVPAGCDTVIRYEDVTIKENTATINVESLAQGESIHKQSADARKDEILLEPGLTISPAEVALLSSVGKSSVTVLEFPRAAIISTGDELVEIDQIPKPYQIRRSNTYALQAAMRGMGWEATAFHLADEKESMTKTLATIAGAFDVLILSGGVSKGRFDFVPEVLEATGIKKVFHQVSQRPGKPFWFGKSATGKIAFALPGNPVSTFMCFYKYIKPWALKSVGITEAPSFARLAADFSFPQKLTLFLQVSVRNEGGIFVAYPMAGGGSGDFANLKNVTGFLELPLEKNDFKAGEVFPYLEFRL
jgi:molybdopterin molybdotransferase